MLSRTKQYLCAILWKGKCSLTFSYLGGRIDPKSKVAAFLRVTIAVLHSANSFKDWLSYEDVTAFSIYYAS